MKYKNIALSIVAAASMSSVAFAQKAPVDAITFSKVTTSKDTGNVTITGDLKPSLNYTSLSVNSSAATITDNKFSVTLPASSNYDLVLVDKNSNSTSLTYKSSDTVVTQALQAVVGDALLKGVGPAASTLLTDLDIMKVAGLSPNKCIVDTWLLIGCDMYITEAFLGGKPNLNLGFEDTGSDELSVNADVSLPQVVLNASLKRAWWWGYDYIRLDVRNTDVKAQVTVRATENEGLKIVLDEPSDVNLQIGQINVQSNNLLARLIPYFRTAITSIVNKHLVNIAGPILAKYEIKNIPINLPLDLNSDGKNDAEFAINLGFNKFDVVGGDDGLVRLSANMKSKTVKEGREAIGSRTIGAGYYAEDGVKDPTVVKASLLEDFANQLLLAVYQSGLEESLDLKFQVKQLPAFASLLGQYGLTNDDNLFIKIGFGALPELSVKKSENYGVALDVNLPTANVVMSTDKDMPKKFAGFVDVPEWKRTADGKSVLVEFSGDLKIQTALGIADDGKLLIDFRKSATTNDDKFIVLSKPDTKEGSYIINASSALFGSVPNAINTLNQQLVSFFPNFGTDLETIIKPLTDDPNFKLDLGKLLNGAIKDASFPSVPVSVGVTEAGVDSDEKFLDLGIGVNFNPKADAASTSSTGTTTTTKKRYINDEGKEFDPLNFEDYNHPCYYDYDYSRCYSDLSKYEKYLK